MSCPLVGRVVPTAVVAPLAHCRAQRQHLVFELRARLAGQHVKPQGDVVGYTQGAVLVGNHQSGGLLAGAAEHRNFGH